MWVFWRKFSIKGPNYADIFLISIDVMYWFCPFDSLSQFRGIYIYIYVESYMDSCGKLFMFSLICAWTNGWVKNQEAGDLRRHRAHYDVPVMLFSKKQPGDAICGHWSGSTLAQVTPFCLIAPRHHLNVDLSSVRSSGIHLSAILQEMPQPSATEVSLKITYLNFCSNISGANELIAALCLPLAKGG